MSIQTVQSTSLSAVREPQTTRRKSSIEFSFLREEEDLSRLDPAFRPYYEARRGWINAMCSYPAVMRELVSIALELGRDGSPTPQKHSKVTDWGLATRNEFRELRELLRRYREHLSREKLNPEETQEISEFLSRIDWPYDQINKLYTNLVKDQVDADTVRESFGRLSSCESNLVTANRRLIGVAIKNLRRTSFREALLALDHEERESQGLTSLSRAVRLFEPKTLMRFATYAVATISNNFKTALRAEMRSRGKLPKISLDEPIGENNGDTKASVIPASPQADSISQKALISWHAAVIESLIEALFALPVEYRDAYISQNSNIQELLERSGISCGVACTSERKGKEDLIKRWLCKLDYQAFRRLRVLGKNKEDPGPPPEIGERIMARPVASLDLDLAPLRIKNIFLMELTIGMFVDMSLGELKRKPYNLKCDEIGIIIDSIRRNPQINDHVPRLRIASEGLV